MPRALIFGHANVILPNKNALRAHFVYPNVLESALLVYKITADRPVEASVCSGALRKGSL